MYTFVIEAPNNKAVHDFSFHLEKAVEYHNWLLPYQRSYDILYDNGTDGIDWSKILTPHQIVPIGSLEFVYRYTKNLNALDEKFINPINIPPELRSHYFTGRKIGVSKYSDSVSEFESFGNDVFVKSHTKYKGYCDIQRPHYTMPERDNYFVSELIDIVSEYRCFVHNGKLIGMKHYAGECLIFPDANFIRLAIQNYKRCPPSYTLDVAVLSNKLTVVVEVHPTVSTGLYGFDNYKYLPSMMINGYRWMLEQGLIIQAVRS